MRIWLAAPGGKVPAGKMRPASAGRGSPEAEEEVVAAVEEGAEGGRGGILLVFWREATCAGKSGAECGDWGRVWDRE